MMIRTAMVCLLALPLLACGDGDGPTKFTMNSDNSADGKAQLSIDAPGFKGSITIPKPDIDASDFKLDDVPLYPGSKIDALNIAADEGEGDAQDKGKVQVRFHSPATPQVVRDWFQAELTRAGSTVEPYQSGLKGKTEDGDTFVLSLTPDGADGSTGEIVTDG